MKINRNCVPKVLVLSTSALTTGCCFLQLLGGSWDKRFVLTCIFPGFWLIGY